MDIKYVRYGDYTSQRFIGTEIPTDQLLYQGGTSTGSGIALIVGEPLTSYYSPSATERSEQAKWLQADGIVAVEYQMYSMGSWPSKITGIRRATFTEMGQTAEKMAREIEALTNDTKQTGWTSRRWIDRKGYISSAEVSTARRLAKISISMMERSIQQKTSSGMDLARVRMARRRIM